MKLDIRNAIVKIESADASGTGFVISSDGIIVTCSHVVQSIQAQQEQHSPPPLVRITYYMSKQQGTASVIPSMWATWEAGDIAFLQAEQPVPTDVLPLPLSYSTNVQDHDFETLGFPEIGSIQELRAKGQIRGLIQNRFGHSRLQLAEATEITSGLSGAPLLDITTKHIVGMVTTVATTDELGKLSGTAFAIPIEELAKLYPALPVKNVFALPAHFNDHFVLVDAEEVSYSKWKSKFYNGSEPTWQDIANNYDSTRNITSRILERAIQASDQPTFLLVSGDPGAGKSTILKRIGWELAKSGKLVVSQLASSGVPSIAVLRQTYESTKRLIYLLIDNIFRKQNIQDFVDDIANSNIPIFVIATARTSEIRPIQYGLLVQEYELGAIDPDELTHLLKKLIEMAVLPIYSDEALQSLRDSLREETQMFVIISKLLGGKDLQVRLRDELERLQSKVFIQYKAYTYVALFYSIGIPMPISLLKRLTKVDDIYIEILTPDDSCPLVKSYTEPTFRTNHELEAEIIRDTVWRSREAIIDAYSGVMNVVDPEEQNERKLVPTILRNLITHGMRIIAISILGRLSRHKFEEYLNYSEETELLLDWAYVLYNLAEYEKLETCYLIGLAKYSSSASLHLSYARFLNDVGSLAGNQDQDVQYYYQSAISLEVGTTYAANSYAAYLIDQMRIDEAVEILESALETTPGNTHLLSTFARLMLSQGDYESAENYYKSAIESNPRELYARHTYGKFLWSQGKTQRALDILEDVLKINPNSGMVLYQFVSYCRHTKQLTRALEQLKALVQINPYNISAQSALLDLFLELEEWHEAANCGIVAVVQHPNKQSLRRSYAYALFQLNRYEEAANHFEKYLNKSTGQLTDCLLLIKLSAQLTRTDLNNLARMRVRELVRKQFEADGYPINVPILAECQESVLLSDVQRFNTDIIPKLLYAQFLVSKSRGVEAETLLSTPLTQDFDESCRIRYLIHFLTQQARPNDAESLVRMARTRWSSSLWPHLTLLTLLSQRIEKTDEYETVNKYIVDHFPQFKLAQLSEITQLIVEEKLDEAKGKLEQIIRLNRRNIDFRKKYVKILLRLGLVDEAEYQLREVLRYQGRDTEARLILVSLLKNKGNFDEVRTHIAFLQEIEATPPAALLSTDSQGESILPRLGLLNRRIRPSTSESQHELIPLQLMGLEELEASLILHPTSSGRLARYIMLLKEKNQIEEAKLAIEKAIAFHTPPRASIRRLYAELLGELKEYDEAERQFRLCLVEHPNKPKTYISFSLFLFDQNRLSEAQSIIEEGKNTAALNIEAKGLTLAGQLARDLGDMQKADRYYRMAIIMYAEDPISHFAYADFLSKLGTNNQAAQKHFLTAMQLKPDHIAARQAYALLLRNIGQSREALAELRNILQGAPSNVPVLHACADLLLDENPSVAEAQEAKQFLYKAIEVEPQHIPSRLTLALLLKKEGEEKEAEKQFIAAIATGTTSYTVKKAYAKFLHEKRYARKEDLMRAEQLFLAAIDPRVQMFKAKLHNAIVYKDYADLLKKLNRPTEEIIACYQNALDIEPRDTASRFHKQYAAKAYAEYLCSIDQFEEACSEFQKALKLNLQNAHIRNSYANCLRRRGENWYEEALENFESVIDFYWDIPDAELDNLSQKSFEIALGGAAKILCKLGEVLRAFRYFEAALDMNPDNIQILIPYADELIRAGDKVTATKVISQLGTLLDSKDSRLRRLYTGLRFL